MSERVNWVGQALAAEAGMSILSCWLDFIRDRLEQHVFWARPIRQYIRDTTGAWTLQAFLEKQVQARSPLTLQYFKLNRPGRAYDPTHDEIRSSDFLTHRGTSCRTQHDAEHEILENLLVSHKRVCLPDVCKRRRLCGKTPPIPQRLWSPAGCGAQQNVALSQQDEKKKSIEEESAACLVADLNQWADDFLQQQESSSQQNASTASTEKDATDFRRP